MEEVIQPERGGTVKVISLENSIFAIKRLSTMFLLKKCSSISQNRSKYQIVKTVIDDLDLYGLLAGGAPADEFDSESREIANRITKDITPHQIAGVIANVFNKAFDLHAQDDEFTEPASRIWALLQSRDSENG